MPPATAPAEDSPRYKMLQAGLDLLDQGITVFDGDLRLVAWNRTFLELLEFPEQLAYVGAPFESFIRCPILSINSYIVKCKDSPDEIGYFLIKTV